MDEIAPDLIEPIVAYRCWRYRLSADATTLMPFSDRGGNDWEGSWRRWVVASCPSGMHRAPDERCACGFYALKSVDAVAFMITDLWSKTSALEPEGIVLGRVELAGKIVEHDQGYRAERARVAGLIPTTANGAITRSVAASLDLRVGAELDTRAILEESATLDDGWDAAVTGRTPRPETRRSHLRLIQGGRDN
jgi:hypothetical protein